MKYKINSHFLSEITKHKDHMDSVMRFNIGVIRYVLDNHLFYDIISIDLKKS
jgi:hypothetical protein